MSPQMTRSLGALAVLPLIACSGARVFSPQARFTLCDAAATPGPGELRAGTEAFHQGEPLWGATLVGGALEVRGLLADRLEATF